LKRLLGSGVPDFKGAGCDIELKELPVDDMYDSRYNVLDELGAEGESSNISCDGGVRGRYSMRGLGVELLVRTIVKV